MDILINSVGTIFLQCLCISSHGGVCFKYLIILFVNYASVNPGGRKKLQLESYSWLFSNSLQLFCLQKSDVELWLSVLSFKKAPVLLTSRNTAEEAHLLTLRYLVRMAWLGHFSRLVSITSTSSTNFPWWFRIRTRLTVSPFPVSTLWEKTFSEIVVFFSHVSSEAKTHNLLGFKLSHWPPLIS